MSRTGSGAGKGSRGAQGRKPPKLRSRKVAAAVAAAIVRRRAARTNGRPAGPAAPIELAADAFADPFEVRLARPADVAQIPRVQLLLSAAKRAGAIISERSTEYLQQAIRERRAAVVLRDGALVGFATAHPWESKKFVSHSAMVIAPEFRGRGLARRLKQTLIDLSRRRWPDAAIVSLTLSHAVERMNQSFGFVTVPYCDLTKDPGFWKGCEDCVHFPHLKRNQQQDCHCWAGLLVPRGHQREQVIPRDAHGHPSAAATGSVVERRAPAGGGGEE